MALTVLHVLYSHDSGIYLLDSCQRTQLNHAQVNDIGTKISTFATASGGAHDEAYHLCAVA